METMGRIMVRFLRKRDGLFKTFSDLLEKIYQKVYRKRFIDKYLEKSSSGKETVFNFNGAILPDVSENREIMNELLGTFENTFLVSCSFNDNYDKQIVEAIDKCTPEGPYGFTDGDFDVTVKPGDIVIDAGAWIGDFSAYAASKGAFCYAFEPTEETFHILKKTSELNDFGKISAIQKGLGKAECQLPIYLDKDNSIGNSIIQHAGQFIGGIITITSLDRFILENNIERVDFIKADIEGAERDMILGASHILKTFAPKLAICTYHLPDDPQILEQMILEINPAYTIKHLSHKLFGAVLPKAVDGI
jgi:FkbM family methyltransferase